MTMTQFNQVFLTSINLTVLIQIVNQVFFDCDEEAYSAPVRAVLVPCVGSIYIAPRSHYKQETIDHIIDVMFYMNSKFGNQVNFMITGDFNNVPIADILSANGAMKQVVSEPTRKSAVLEEILTDLATFYPPQTSLAPL